MNHYYTTLELHKILDMLAKQASNEKTRDMALSIEPLTDLSSVKSEMAKTADAFSLSVQFGTPVFLNFKNVTGSLKRAKSGAKLSLRELLDIAQMLNQIHILCDWYKQCSGIDSAIGYLFASLTPNKSLEEHISNAILSEDEVSDSASSELSSIRRKITRAGIQIRENLDKMIKSSTIQKSLQEILVTMRDGRYVLPVKAESKASIPGLVHDTSSSGQTLFIEPMSVVEANNDIRVLKSREAEEVDRIITELSARCGEIADSVMEDFLTCAELNLYFSKANLGAKMRASIPEMVDDGAIVLRNARHPLIDPAQVVPIHVELGIDYQTLIITGPNTGGKTVVLKTVGLLTAMTMCGLMIPVSDGSRVSIFKNILVDIGDQQSIEHSLSTFSSHMNQVIDILQHANQNSLVLLDELGSGTDPVEGSALAVAIIENLQKQGSRLMVTTHYQELKLYAIETSGVENASCEFDVQTLRPTFRLIIGSPGKSNAFAISARLGVPAYVIERAKTLVSTENKRLEEVISQLEAARQELESQKEEVKSIQKQHAETLEKLETERGVFEKERDGLLEQARVQAMRIVESVRSQSDTLLDELASLRKEKEKESFFQKSIEAKSKTRSVLDHMYAEANPVVTRSNDGYRLPRPLKKGDHVLVVDIDKKGFLIADPDASGMAIVQLGIMKTRVNINRLRLVEIDDKVTVNGKKAKKQYMPASRISTKGVASKVQRRAELELDIRGRASDEGVHELEAFLNNAVLSGVGMVTIIHGKGTGILRDAVHRALKSHPSVKSYRLGVFGEGEDGVTIVELK